MSYGGPVPTDDGGAGQRGEDRLGQLLQELSADEQREDTERTPEELLDAVDEALDLDGSFAFDEGVVKQSLDEIVLVLIALRTSDRNGKAILGDLSHLFDSQLSPGTVYPSLHEMNADGTLNMFELVRSKEYSLDDREQAADRVAAAARQHLALGAFLHAAAAEL